MQTEAIVFSVCIDRSSPVDNHKCWHAGRDKMQRTMTEWDWHWAHSIPFRSNQNHWHMPVTECTRNSVNDSTPHSRFLVCHFFFNFISFLPIYRTSNEFCKFRHRIRSECVCVCEWIGNTSVQEASESEIETETDSAGNRQEAVPHFPFPGWFDSSYLFPSPSLTFFYPLSSAHSTQPITHTSLLRKFFIYHF